MNKQNKPMQDCLKNILNKELKQHAEYKDGMEFLEIRYYGFEVSDPTRISNALGSKREMEIADRVFDETLLKVKEILNSHKS